MSKLGIDPLASAGSTRLHRSPTRLHHICLLPKPSVQPEGRRHVERSADHRMRLVGIGAEVSASADFLGWGGGGVCFRKILNMDSGRLGLRAAKALHFLGSRLSGALAHPGFRV